MDFDHILMSHGGISLPRGAMIFAMIKNADGFPMGFDS